MAKSLLPWLCGFSTPNSHNLSVYRTALREKDEEDNKFSTLIMGTSKVISTLLEEHPSFGSSIGGVGIDIFDRRDLNLTQNFRLEAAEFIISCLPVLGLNKGKRLEQHIEIILRTAIGVDDFSNTIKKVVSGRPINQPSELTGLKDSLLKMSTIRPDGPEGLWEPGELGRPEGSWEPGGPRSPWKPGGPRYPLEPGGTEGPKLPGLATHVLKDINDVLNTPCGLGLRQALRDFAKALADNAVITWANGIESVSPIDGCPGDTLTIKGKGFGNKKYGVIFPNNDPFRNYVPAEVLTWTDTEVTVIIPENVGWGCLGFYKRNNEGENSTNFDAAEGELADLIESCLGGTGFGIGLSTLLFNKVPCLDGGANNFKGGLPLILEFMATPAQLNPDQSLTLKWEVRGADEVKIAAIQPPGVSDPLPDIKIKLDPNTGSYFIFQVQGNSSWERFYEIEATNHCTKKNAVKQRISIKMVKKIAFALSGGGAKGDFEVGALKYIYEKGIRPDILTGTSVGAVNAVKLAEGDDTIINAQQKLENIWRSLQTNSDMFAIEQWILTIANSKVIGFLTDLGYNTATTVLSWVNPFNFIYSVITAGININDLSDAVNKFSSAQSLLNLGPLEKLMQNPANLDVNKVNNSGIELRMATISLETGEILYINETGRVEGSGGGTTDLVSAVIASASIPSVFPARKIGSHHTCVDGGVREIIPIRKAIDLGANEIYAIITGPPMSAMNIGVNPNILQVTLRSFTNLMVEDVLENDYKPYRGFPPEIKLKIIRPTITVHNMLTIDPGLIDISISYGYMRAGEVIDLDENDRFYARQNSDKIIQLRVEIWQLEHFALGEMVPSHYYDEFSVLKQRLSSQSVMVPDPSAMQEVRNKKKLLRNLLQTRKNSGYPIQADCYKCWENWELHNWNWVNLMNSPWDEYHTTGHFRKRWKKARLLC